MDTIFETLEAKVDGHLNKLAKSHHLNQPHNLHMCHQTHHFCHLSLLLHHQILGSDGGMDGGLALFPMRDKSNYYFIYLRVVRNILSHYY